MSPDVIERFFIAVVEQLPIPIILYSSPGVSAGIEMDSGLPGRISQHPNVAGTKFTCGDTGKLSRAATAMKSRQTYAIFGGLADFILPAFVAGATGVIAGGANVTPKTCVKVFDLWREGKVEVAREMQAVLAQGDWEHMARLLLCSISTGLSYYSFDLYGNFVAVACKTPRLDRQEYQLPRYSFLFFDGGGLGLSAQRQKHVSTLA